MNRRIFALRGAMAALCSHVGSPLIAASQGATSQPNLVPVAPGMAPNYWCTWAVQNYMFGQGTRHLDPETLEGESGSRLAHDAMTQQALLGSRGWVKHFFPRGRRDLLLMLDDGWEAGGTATFELDERKFSSFRGSPAARLRELNAAIRDANWRAAAVWCRNTPGGEQDAELMALSAAAGVPYWKIDIGDPDFHLPRVRDDRHLPLLLEHVHGEEPVNGDWHQGGRFGAQPQGSRRQQILAHTDVYRTYDVTSILSLPTTLDRVSEMLHGAQSRPQLHALLNVEDEVYVAAALGCTMGVLRHPLRGLRPAPDLDLFCNGPRQPKRRMDEVDRALLWHRIAPPLPVGVGTFERSDEILTDAWTFSREQTWSSKLVGQTVHQGAPAVIARGMRLPRVVSAGEKPFVFASRSPNGAAAIGVQERTRPDQAWYMPACTVTADFGDAPGPYGIFGCVAKLTLTLAPPRGATRLLAQDLLGIESVDLTSRLRPDRRTLDLAEDDLRSIGLKAATSGDLSSPGLVLAWR